jgi:hypothetical protein
MLKTSPIIKTLFSIAEYRSINPDLENNQLQKVCQLFHTGPLFDKIRIRGVTQE